MIPKTNNILSATMELETLSSRTYELNLEDASITHYCDKLQAMHQLIYKTINTQRYAHIIYSWNFGIELIDLIGEPSSYVYPEVERRIIEALIQDQRIKNVDTFVFHTINKSTVNLSFVVHTIFGDVKADKEVTF